MFHMCFKNYYSYIDQITRKSTLIDFTELNANHIIPSYRYLPVICRNLVDRYGSLGGCKPQIKIYNCIFFLANRPNRRNVIS